MRFLADFEDFAGNPLPAGTVSEYRDYMQRSMDFVRARNDRIADYASRDVPSANLTTERPPTRCRRPNYRHLGYKLRYATKPEIGIAHPVAVPARTPPRNPLSRPAPAAGCIPQRSVAPAQGHHLPQAWATSIPFQHHNC